MINKDEILYKIDAVILYLKENNGENYKVYNKLCPGDNITPDSNILEYAEDIKNMLNIMIEEENNIANNDFIY